MSEDPLVDMSTHFNQLVEQFMKAGASLSDAVQMSREQECHERQLRALEREEARKDQIEQDKLALEKVKQEAEILQHEQNRLDKLALEKAKYESELELKRIQLQNEHDLDQKKIDYQRLCVETEAQTKRHQIETSVRVTASSSSIEHEATHSFRKYELGVGRFDNVSTSLEPFILKFEVVANAYKLPSELWSVELAKCLTDESLAVYESLSPEHRVDYKVLVDALKKKFGLTLKSYRKRFLQAKCLENESLKDYAFRLRRYYLEWLEKAGYPPSFDGILEHLIKDRFFESQDQNVKVFIRERGKSLSLEDMITLADDYVDAHNLYEKKDSGKQDKKRLFRTTDYRRDEKSSEVKNSHKSENTHEAHSKTDNVNAGSENRRKPLICFNCNKPGHKATECRSKTGSSNNSNGWKPSQRTAACHIYNSVEADRSSESNDCEVKTTSKWPTVAVTGQDDVEFIKDLKYPYRGKAKLNR
jgi:hypothetical protein